MRRVPGLETGLRTSSATALMPHRLLLADDSVTIQRVIELTFANEDVEVLTAGDGEQAIARVQADKPDIVLADIGMPKRSGYDVAAFVKGHPELAHVPVLLLTGAFEPVDEARAEASGCDGVLVKPFEPQQIIARVRELLHGAKGSPTHAVTDILRPVERLTHPRSLELPRRESTETTAPDAGLESLDDYFDRLDAAFANLSSSAPAALGDEAFHDDVPPAPVEELAPQNDARAIEGVRGFEPEVERFERPIEITTRPARAELPVTFANPPSVMPGVGWPPPPPVIPVEPPDVSPTLTAGPQPGAAVEDHVEVGDAGRAVADAFSALLAVEQGEPGAFPVRLVATAAPQITEDLIEQIASRVIDRLGHGALREVVADLVSTVAERLVREEIERVRNRTGS